MLKLIYKNEFSEKRLEGVGFMPVDIEEFSYVDEKFLEIMDKNTKKDGKRYQLPLPLKDQKKFPNNKCLAEKRLLHLMRRSIKNPNFLMILLRRVMQNSSSSKLHKEEYVIFNSFRVMCGKVLLAKYLIGPSKSMNSSQTLSSAHNRIKHR